MVSIMVSIGDRIRNLLEELAVYIPSCWPRWGMIRPPMANAVIPRSLSGWIDTGVQWYLVSSSAYENACRIPFWGTIRGCQKVALGDVVTLWPIKSTCHTQLVVPRQLGKWPFTFDNPRNSLQSFPLRLTPTRRRVSYNKSHPSPPFHFFIFVSLLCSSKIKVLSHHCGHCGVDE